MSRERQVKFQWLKSYISEVGSMVIKCTGVEQMCTGLARVSQVKEN